MSEEDSKTPSQCLHLNEYIILKATVSYNEKTRNHWKLEVKNSETSGLVPLSLGSAGLWRQSIRVQILAQLQLFPESSSLED